MSGDSIGGWRVRAEWFGIWLEEAVPWGRYVGAVVDRRWRLGRSHNYYNGPHDQFSVGPVHFCWSINDCAECDAVEPR